MEGTPFGRYCLVELLGRGGMGEVWRAHDSGTNRVVAIKVLPPDCAKDSEFERRFRREAQIAAQLNNAHVIPIHDYGEIDGKLFVDMRLVDGRDLERELKDGPVQHDRAVSIVTQVAAALNAAHRIGLIHRDVKPSNVLVDADDFVYLIDFGIARAVADTSLTSTGTAIGTWAYMAPERFASVELDARTDVYSLACVLYQCLTGVLPYPSGSIEQVVAAHMFAAPPRPSEQNRSLPRAFDKVIAKGMAKRPEDRYASTIELASAARNAALASSPTIWAAGPRSASPTHLTATAPSSPPEVPTVARAASPPINDGAPRNRSRRPLYLGVAAFVVVVVIGLAAISFLLPPKSTYVSRTPAAKSASASIQATPPPWSEPPWGQVPPTPTTPPAPTVGKDAVAQEVSARLSEQVGHRPDSVTCPTDLKSNVGTTLFCTLKDNDQTYGVTVTVTQVDGIDVDFNLKVDDNPSP